MNFTGTVFRPILTSSVGLVVILWGLSLLRTPRFDTPSGSQTVPSQIAMTSGIGSEISVTPGPNRK